MRVSCYFLGRCFDKTCRDYHQYRKMAAPKNLFESERGFCYLNIENKCNERLFHQ